MSKDARYLVLCDTPELAVECAVLAADIGIDLDPRYVDAPLRALSAHANQHGAVGVALREPPTIDELVAILGPLGEQVKTVALAVIGSDENACNARSVASDLGVTACNELAPMVSVLALRACGAQQPWNASLRTLNSTDRARLRSAVDQGTRGQGHFCNMDRQQIGWSESDANPRAVGRTMDVVGAIAALRATNPSAQRVESRVDGIDERAVADILFGPARSLSDPASKAALAPYGIPLPNEELCSSASRAAAEASRIGFPVRIALASPDLRVWQHPDLLVDFVDNAARVRETFRLLTAIATEREASARILGVTVAAASFTDALLQVRLRPLAGGLVETRIGFADPHGVASDDATTTMLPTSVACIERVLMRLAGGPLILKGSSAQRRGTLNDIADVLLRASAFATRHAQAINAVELRPVALLIGGGIEVREACVTINDSFERSYQMASGLG